VIFRLTFRLSRGLRSRARPRARRRSGPPPSSAWGRSRACTAPAFEPRRPAPIP